MSESKILSTTELTTGLIFGEGPRWRDGVLYVSDMLGLKVWAIDSDGEKRLVADLPKKPNGMCFLPDGTHIVGSMHDARLYRVTKDGLVLYADMSHLFTGYVGDMVVDAEGRIYVDDVGARVFEGELMRPGRIIAVEPDGSSSIAAEDMHFPNGIVITRDGKTLIVAETFQSRITAFDLVGGKLTNRRLYRDLSDLRPADPSMSKALIVDGIAIDAEDGIWISMLAAQQFVRIDRHGVETHRIPTPGYECVACTLGGDDGRTLYMVTTHVAAGAVIFEEMRNLRTRSRIVTALVDIPRI